MFWARCRVESTATVSSSTGRLAAVHYTLTQLCNGNERRGKNTRHSSRQRRATGTSARGPSSLGFGVFVRTSMECSSWSLDPGREWSSLVAGSWLYSSRWTGKDEKQETTIPPYLRTYALQDIVMHLPHPSSRARSWPEARYHDSGGFRYPTHLDGQGKVSIRLNGAKRRRPRRE